MYLIHNTKLKSLKNILKDNKLKAAYLSGNINEGYGVYEANQQQFIFFSVIDLLKSKYKMYGNIILYFDYKILWNKTYYVSTVHSDSPDSLGTWNKGKDYKKKYKQYYKNTKYILTKLFKNSVSKLPKGTTFQAFQQVAIKKQCGLQYLRKIKFLRSKPTNKIINFLKKNYPNVIIE
jgi:hypothetical protein